MDTKYLTHRLIHSRILVFAVALLGGLTLTLALLWLMGGAATPVAAAPAPDKAPSPAHEPAEKPSQAPLQASGWETRTDITIYYSSMSPLIDYQVSMTIPHAPGMHADFDDLRFGDTDGNCLSYWVETHTQNISATVWVKVPTIVSPTTMLYMYYGNPAASSASDGDTTFMFFDDFEGASLDTNKWDESNSPHNTTNNGGYKLENGYLKMWRNWGGVCNAGGVYDRINTQANFNKPFVVESKFKVGGTTDQTDHKKCCYICYHTIFDNRDVIGISNESYGFAFRIDNSSETNESYFPDQDTWHRITKSFEQNRLAVRTDYTTTEYIFSGTVASSGPIGLAGDTDLSESQGSDFVDWIAVRKFASTMPTTTLGSPVQAPDLIIAKSVAPATPINPGGPVTYTITFSNVGDVAAANVVITDIAPVSVTNTSVVSSGVALTRRAGTRYAWDATSLAPGAGGVITITGELTDTLPGGHVFTNTVAIAAAEHDCPCGDSRNSDAVPVTVNYAPIAAPDVAPKDVSLCQTGALNGSASSDPDGHLPLSYHWQQTGGPTVAGIYDPFAATTIFTGSCSTPGVITFTLTVTDSLGRASTPEIVTVTVENVSVKGLVATNSSPVPINTTIRFTATITEGSSVSYTWSFGDGNFDQSSDINHFSKIDHVYGSGALTYTVFVTASNTYSTGGAYQTFTDTATTTVTLIVAWPITGTVWDDTNDNSELDASEVISGIADVRMFLYREYSGCVASTTTDNNGVYTFTGVISGDYQVIEAYGYSNRGLSSIATFDASEVVTPCDPRDLATDPPGYASNTPNVQWVTLHEGGGITNRVSPSLWPDTLTSVDFGDEQANPFAACKDAFQTKGANANSINLFKLDVPNANLDIFPPGNYTVYYDINSIGFNEVDNLIYGYRRDEARFTRIDEDGQWTELTATDGFVTYDSYLGDVTGKGCQWGEGYWVLGKNGNKALRIVDVDPSRPTFLKVVNTVNMNANLVGADMAWNPVNDKFYVYNNDRLYEIKFNGQLDASGTATRSEVATMDIPGAGAGAQYFDKKGGFYFYVNDTGDLWKISNVEDISASSLVTPTKVATGTTVSVNDGCGCAEVVEFEYGDAPVSYEPADRARHNFVFEDGIYLGSHQDGELAAQSGTDALGDDNDVEGDDDDGVTREGADWYDQALWANSSQLYTLTLEANSPGYLHVWIDLNGDGDWSDLDEKIASDLHLNAGINYAPTFSVTDDYTGTTYMRFRFTDEPSSVKPVGIGGVVVNGEVEDYLITIDGCADLELTKTVVPTRPVFGGETITFTVIVSNTTSSVEGCDDDAKNVEVTDFLPSGYTYITHTVSQGVYSYTTGIWGIGTITHATAVTLEIAVEAKGGDLENIAEVTDSGAFDPDSTPDNHWPEEDDQDSASVTIAPIGGIVYPLGQIAVWVPWIALAAIVAAAGGGLLAKRRVHRR
jgi:uncharacterized repeat protein (TIGR01451 family)